MSKVVIGTVNLRHPETLEVVTFLPGEDVPEWAESLVTNPAVFQDYTPPENVVAPVEEENPPAPPAPVEPPKGKSKDAPAADPHAELVAKAKELGIEFTDETTDAELELAIASKE